MTKIALLIPTTSRNLPFGSIQDLPIFKWMLPTLLSSITTEEKLQHSITLYLGFDDNDGVYNNLNQLGTIQNEFKYNTGDTNLTLQQIKCIGTNHNPVRVWNTLHDMAFNDNFDYFYQLGDDIQFLTSGWITKFIETLPTNNIGMAGGLDINPSRPGNLITQSFVNRHHMKIFGYYYPSVFTNWHSDNWIQNVYGDKSILLSDMKIKNAGGHPKYSINNKANILEGEVLIGKNKITEYENKIKP